MIGAPAFRIRSGVTFDDGSALSAESAVRSLERALANPGVLEGASVRALRADGGEVVVELREPFSALPGMLAHSTALILTPASYAADGSVAAAIGTGPYRVVELAPPQSMRLEAFGGYWGPAPRIRQARYLAAGRAETRALLAESGDAALVFTLDPPAAFPARVALGRTFRDLASLHRIAWGEITALLERLGIVAALLDRRPGEVSGGELQRLALARVLAVRPAVILADEPTSRLDPITQHQVMDLLAEVAQRAGVAVVLVTHSEEIAGRWAHRQLRIG